MAGTPNRHGRHICDIVSTYFFQISQRKPDLIIEPHGDGPKRHMGPSFAHTSPGEGGRTGVGQNDDSRHCSNNFLVGYHLNIW